MTVELITGHAGSAHISAADDGWYNVGVVGAGKYVLDTGTQFACNVQSANLVTVGIGDALFEGRHVRVSATENVALDNGAQGVNRNDLICIKYEYDSSTSVESASLVVIKGTASSSTPSDPDIPSGSILEGATAAYMPLWRIPISGITVGTPVKLYGEVLAPIDSIYSKTWAASQIPNLPASKITSGTFDAARIPSLDASKITSGTFGVDRIPTLTAAKIPSLDASKITSGTFDAARIPNLAASKISNPTWVPKATALYNNATGTTGTVALSASAASYNHMRIYYRVVVDSYIGYGSETVYSPNGKTVVLAPAMQTSGANATWWTKRVSISGTSITRVNEWHFSLVMSTGVVGGNTNSNNIYIYRVEGWNE